jgi:hypothetical protein
MSNPTSWFSILGSADVLFPFLECKGPAVPSQLEFERVRRSGVNGVGFWYTGRRGAPFTLSTLCDYPTVSASASEFASYRNFVGVALDFYHVRRYWGPVFIHRVALDNMFQTGVMLGGVNVSGSTSGSILSATWQVETLHS